MSAVTLHPQVHGPSIPRLRLGELGKLSWSFAVMDLNPCFGKKAEGGESSGSESDAEEQGFEEPATKHNRKALKQQLSVVDELLRCTSQSKTKQLQQSSKVVRGQLSYAVRIWAAAGHAHKKCKYVAIPCIYVRALEVLTEGLAC
eukprot:scaffold23127_cov16-Tisochrysis_lutea.AAC.2